MQPCWNPIPPLGSRTGREVEGASDQNSDGKADSRQPHSTDQSSGRNDGWNSHRPCPPVRRAAIPARRCGIVRSLLARKPLRLGDPERTGARINQVEELRAIAGPAGPLPGSPSARRRCPLSPRPDDATFHILRGALDKFQRFQDALAACQAAIRAAPTDEGSDLELGGVLCLPSCLRCGPGGLPRGHALLAVRDQSRKCLPRRGRG